MQYASERNAGESREAHIERVVREFAGPAFWQEVGKAFPQVRTGDFGPEETGRIEQAMLSAIETWLMWNEPAPTHDQLTRLAELVGRASMGANGVTHDITARLVGRAGVPSPAQAGVDIEDTDLVVVMGATYESAERTNVAIIGREGAVKASYEVQ